MNQPYATLTLASALREMFGVQLYKNNVRALLSRILSILNLDWLQHAPSVRGVYEKCLMHSLYCTRCIQMCGHAREASHWPIHFLDILCTEIILRTNTNYLAFCHVWIKSITAHLLSAHEKRQTNALSLSFNACAMDSAQSCRPHKLRDIKISEPGIELVYMHLLTYNQI